MKSPYQGIATTKWPSITQKLVEQHPLSRDEIIEVVLNSWDSLFKSRLGIKGFKIGVDIFPKPQIMGFFLHELIPLELTARYPDVWRTEASSFDKDIVHMPDDRYSIELKTSSNPRHIYGNRSYSQDGKKEKKTKSGYYLAVNFEKFLDKKIRPSIKLIRFGWLDASDWIGQKAATGQQARLLPEAERFKLSGIYSSK